MGNDERGHVALPKLYGAPAYARPTAVPVQRSERPFDPDDLPLEAELTGDERDVVGQLIARPYVAAAPAQPAAAPREGRPMLRGRPFRLRGPGKRPKDG